MVKLLSISELSNLLDLVNKKNDKPLNYILRYWEKEFKQIKPKIINKRRYYTKEQVEIIKLVKFLLKDKGMTVKGVKNLLNLNMNNLDDYKSNSLKANYHKQKFKEKTKAILNRLRKIKEYGKKNTY
tara:strand:+ start:180 stop:560 length:381 start_codon:yes stop_codon:yes gene_type:complete